MIKIPLNHGRFAIVDDCDSHFFNYKWHFARSHGSEFGYASRSIRISPTKTKNIPLHHAIIGYPLNGLKTDHIDGNALNNRRSNLRFVTARENQQNRIEHRKGKLFGTHFMGHHRTSFKKWQARIWINGKHKSIGYFKTEKEAHEAYKNALQHILSVSV